MARRLGLERHVLFLGQQKMVFGLMKSAQCFLSTSEYEGYGMSIVEAGLAHLPVVATDVGIAGEVLVNRVNAYVCPVGDTLCMVSHIRTLISHNTERMLIADRLYTDVSAHIPSYDTYVAEYVKGIEDTVKNSGIVE